MNWRICVTLWLILGVYPLVAVGDWNHWRGPEQNGISRETNLVDDWSLTDNKNVLWVSETGAVRHPSS